MKKKSKKMKKIAENNATWTKKCLYNYSDSLIIFCWTLGYKRFTFRMPQLEAIFLLSLINCLLSSVQFVHRRNFTGDEEKQIFLMEILYGEVLTGRGGEEKWY